MTEQANELETRKKVILFREVLTKIVAAETRPYPLEARNVLRVNLAKLLWEELPKHVTMIDLGNQLTVKRSEEEIKYVPISRRETWSISRINEYAAKLSRSVNESWVPIFQAGDAK